MAARRMLVRSIFPVLLLLPLGALSQPAAGDAPDAALVQRALAAELRTVLAGQRPMRYRLRKSSPRLTTTKEIVETKDGAVARLVAVNDMPLNRADEEKEESRLNSLLINPNQQRHRKMSEDQDTARAMKVLRALPTAFLYEFDGTAEGPSGKVEKFSFRPNPRFDPPDLETQLLTAMTGEIWIDAAQQRVTRLEGHLDHDVDFGWGILGRLNKGGWIVIDQQDVGDHQWRIVRFQMQMSGRVLFKTKDFDTVEEESHFAPLPAGLSYVQAVQMLRAASESAVSGRH